MWVGLGQPGFARTPNDPPPPPLTRANGLIPIPRCLAPPTSHRCPQAGAAELRPSPRVEGADAYALGVHKVQYVVGVPVPQPRRQKLCNCSRPCTVPREIISAVTFEVPALLARPHPTPHPALRHCICYSFGYFRPKKWVFVFG